MDLLQPRPTYQRAETDEPDLLAPSYDSIELSPLHTPSLNTQPSFASMHKDNDALLEYTHELPSPTPKPRRRYTNSGRPLSHLSKFSIIPKGWSHRFEGWKAGALGAAGLAMFSFLINLGVLIWLGTLRAHSSLVEVYNGDCDTVQTLDVWVHLGINALSTLLLGGSNYCMQCLCAPTRADVDRAHAKGKFLDIGVPSLRNLRGIPLYKTLLWWMLGLSSVPLHLMYNSAFYKSLSTNDYLYLIVKQEFVDTNSFTYNTTDVEIGYYVNYTLPEVDLQSDVKIPGRYQRLEKADCIKAYATNFVTSRRNLLLVAQNDTVNYTLLDGGQWDYSYGVSAGQDYSPYDWLCTSDPNIEEKITVPMVKDLSRPKPCDTYVSKVVAIADKWEPYGQDVQFCLSETVPDRCTYSGNVPIIVVVVISNAIKIVGMLFVAFRLRDSPLITVGDAVQSFLNDNDATTKGICLLTKKEVVRYLGRKQHWQIENPTDSRPSIARVKTRRWSSAASSIRWFVTIGLIALAIIVVCALLVPALNVIERSNVSWQSLGFGKVNAVAIIQGWNISNNGSASKKILESVLIANSPQAILSFLYVNLNGLLTSMWLAAEWDDFANERKTLRVSAPKGEQRTTHFLQLPYKIAIPLMIMSGVLHWVISQSIFLAVIEEYTPTGVLDSGVAGASCGFSPMAMIVVIVLGGCIIVATIALGRRRYNGTIPLVGSCSAAISAACHQPDWDNEASLKAVQWGVIPHVSDGKEIGHCAFSSGDVDQLQDGQQYAGIS